MGEKETATDLERKAPEKQAETQRKSSSIISADSAPGGSDPAGLAIGDQGTTEAPHGGGGGGGGGSHGHLFGQGGELPTQPEGGNPGDPSPPGPSDAAVVKSRSNVRNN